jgi:hypothetical protein
MLFLNFKLENFGEVLVPVFEEGDSRIRRLYCSYVISNLFSFFNVVSFEFFLNNHKQFITRYFLTYAAISFLSCPCAQVNVTSNVN